MAVVDRSQIAYRLAGGTKWVSAVTSPGRWRANLEEQLHRQSKDYSMRIGLKRITPMLAAGAAAVAIGAAPIAAATPAAAQPATNAAAPTVETAGWGGGWYGGGRGGYGHGFRGDYGHDFRGDYGHGFRGDYGRGFRGWRW
jgi:hypothetical protein